MTAYFSPQNSRIIVKCPQFVESCSSVIKSLAVEGTSLPSTTASTYSINDSKVTLSNLNGILRCSNTI